MKKRLCERYVSIYTIKIPVFCDLKENVNFNEDTHMYNPGKKTYHSY